ncbi:MAG: hypothetical protein IPM47_17460 [Sphingobacteriales bacterium]|nr:MAG: hypothetical protein IPM47_17460 [Sphingobacteriales bacterium]
MTPNTEEQQAQDISLFSHYVDVVLWNLDYLKSISNYLAVDAYTNYNLILHHACRVKVFKLGGLFFTI